MLINVCSAAVRAQRLGLGLCVLLSVDLLWVASSELTEYIFKSQHFRYARCALYTLYAVHAVLCTQCTLYTLYAVYWTL